MKPIVSLFCISALLTSAALAAAQGGMPAAEVPPPDEAAEIDPVDLMRQLGAGQKEIMMFRLMSDALGADMAQMVLMMMLGQEMGMDDDMFGFLLFSKALSGGKGTATEIWGDYLLVIEDGTVYRINLKTMEAEGSVAYQPKKTGGGIPAALLPMLQGAKQKAQGASSLSNLKQLGLGALMYAQDNDNILPTEGWTEQLDPYIKNRAIYASPGAPGLEVGYALNEAIAGAKMGDIARPAEIALFFGSDNGADIPFGGPEAVPDQGRFDGTIGVGFVDGHVELVTTDRARELLQQNPFE